MAIPIVMASARARYETPIEGYEPFEGVPIEIIQHICAKVPEHARSTLRLVSKQWRAALYSNAFTDVHLRGNAVFFLPNVQLTSDDAADAAQRVDVPIPRWAPVLQGGRTVPWSVTAQLGMECAETTVITDGRVTESVNVVMNLQVFQAYLEAQCRRSLRPTKANAAPWQSERSPRRYPLFVRKPTCFSRHAEPDENDKETAGCTDNDTSNDNVPMRDADILDDAIESASESNSDRSNSSSSARGEPWTMPESVRRCLEKLDNSSGHWVHHPRRHAWGETWEWLLDKRPFQVDAVPQSSNYLLVDPATTRNFGYHFSDPYATAAVFGDEVLHPGVLTLINGRRGKDHYGIWICIGGLVLNTCRLNTVLDTAADSVRKNVLRRALGTIVSIEHRPLESPSFSFQTPHASLHNARAAPAIASIPWREELALYDFQKETVRSLAQIEEQIIARRPFELRATHVIAFNKVPGGLYVDKLTNAVLSGAEGYAIKTGATEPVRVDNILFYTQGGLLMDEVGMGKTRQVVALVAHFPVRPPRALTDSLAIVKRKNLLSAHYAGEWHTDMPCADPAAVRDHWPLRDLYTAPSESSTVVCTATEYVTSSATLVICGNHLVDQWCTEATRAFPNLGTGKNTRVLVIGSKRDHEAVTLGALATANIVIVTIQFLCGAYYRNTEDSAWRLPPDEGCVRLAPAAVKPAARAVPLDAIEWARLVVDEASTLTWNVSGASRTERIPCIAGIKSVTRWLLSATLDDALFYPTTRERPAVQPETQNKVVYVQQRGYEHLILEQFLGWHFRIPMGSHYPFAVGSVRGPRRDALFWLPHSNNNNAPAVASIMHEALSKTTFRQTKQSTIREHYVSKPLNHGIQYDLAPREERFVDIVTAVPVPLRADTLAMVHHTSYADARLPYKDHRIQHRVFLGDRAVFLAMARRGPGATPLKLDDHADVAHTNSNIRAPFLTNILLEPMASLDNEAFFNLATRMEENNESTKLDTHKERMKELHLQCVAGHTLIDVVIAWIQFYTRLEAAADREMDRCWDALDKLREPFIAGLPATVNRKVFYDFRCAAGKLLAEFMFNERLKLLARPLWIAPLETLLEELKAKRAALMGRASGGGPGQAALRRLNAGSRIHAVLTTMEHLWAREPTLVMIVASAHYDLLRWLAHYWDERGIEHVDYNRANYHGKRKAIARIREEGTSVRVVLYHFGGKSTAHEGSNLPEVSTILFLDARCGASPSEFDAQRTQTQGRAYRHGQRYQINVIDFYEPKHVPLDDKEHAPLIALDMIAQPPAAQDARMHA
jgi:hypothetical protein